MPLVYLETSFVSAIVTDKTDTASLYQMQISNQWWQTQRFRHDVFISQEVLAELSDPAYPCRQSALEVVEGVPLLAITEEVGGLAAVLVREKLMPSPIAGDAVHVAAATVHQMDYVLSWNVRHLANARKVDRLTAVCGRFGYLPPRIITPDMLWEDYE